MEAEGGVAAAPPVQKQHSHMQSDLLGRADSETEPLDYKRLPKVSQQGTTSLPSERTGGNKAEPVDVFPVRCRVKQ